MPIISTEIKFYQTTNGLGGAITGTEATDSINDIFDLVTSTESSVGSTEYRCIYVKNTNGVLTLSNAVNYIVTNTPLTSTNLFIGLGTSSIGGVEQIIASETTAPIGITFTDLLGVGNALNIGSVPAGSHMAIWLKRVVDAGASASASDGAQIIVSGDTSS